MIKTGTQVSLAALNGDERKTSSGNSSSRYVSAQINSSWVYHTLCWLHGAGLDEVTRSL